MKASELMIGDLVFSPKLQKVFKVMGIENDHDEIKSVGCHIPMRILESIPLTKEILKDNGFNDKNELYVNDNCFLVYDFTNNHLIISYFVYGVNVVYFDMCIMYVHELQHTLRLCGLNDLADNFKIKEYIV